jgi:carbamate kinase
VGKLVLLAVGGNALIRSGQNSSADEQFTAAMDTAAAVVRLIRAGYRIVLTHGNGPQVGAMLIRSDRAAEFAYRMPYDCCVAATQGEIGYILQYALWQMLQKEGMSVPVVTLVTQVLVKNTDPAFTHPTKPIGPFYSKEEAARFRKELGWNMVEDARRGWRRVVPSPIPREIIELEAIRACVDRGLVVIAAGGGGVPVSNDHDITKGVEAVIDKDLTSAILAAQLKADVFLIATGEERVVLDYKTPHERPLPRLTDVQARRHLAEGQFPEGSMGPKIQAALAFLERGGGEVIITDIDHLLPALEGTAGTSIRPSAQEMLDWP